MLKILLLDENHPLLEEGLKSLGFQVEKDYTSDHTTIQKKIAAYQGLVIRSRIPIDKQLLSKAENLKFIARVGAGLENIDVTYAKSKGIDLINAPEGNRNAVGEHTLGLVLALLNKFKKSNREIENGLWLREDNRGLELDGKTVGIIGYGNMGNAFAKKLCGFDLRCICYDIKDQVGNENCTQVSLQELQKHTDILSIHTPHNELSHNMVNEEFINNFHKNFFLINTARGSAVVTKDLVQALKKGKILGAGLDVLAYEKASFENLFENTPIPEDLQYLIKAPKVILTPHIAGWTQESKIKLAQTILEKITQLGLHV